MKSFLNKNFARTGLLLKFVIRRERIMSAIWILSIVLATAVIAPTFNALADNPALIEMLQTPAVIAMVGPVYGYTAGALFAAEMMLFVAIAVAVMNIFFVIRHTRSDEEKGRTEVLRSLPVGRLSILTSTLIGALIVNLILATLSFLSIAFLPFDGFGVGGALVFGLGLGVVGFVFAGISAVLGQFFQSSRTAAAYAFGLLILFYIMRAIGDVAAEGLSWISPLGLVLRTQAFVANKALPIVILLVIGLVLSVVALWLSSVRDIEQGLIPAKRGRDRAGLLLRNAFGMSFKLVRTMLIVFAIGLFLLGVSYGSIMNMMDDFISGNEFLQAAFPDVEAFVAMIIVMTGIVACIPVMIVQKRLIAEEKEGRMESVLACPVCRVRLFLGFYVIAALSAIVMLFVSFLGLWGASAAVLDTPPSFGILLGQTMAYLPALLFMIGVAALLAGILPKKGFIAWIFLGFSFFISYFGGLLNFPSWTQFLSPFGFVPNFVGGANVAVAIVRLVGLTVVSLAMTTVGLIMYRRRDIKHN